MIFIGIITDSKSEEAISQLIKSNNFFRKNNVIFIKEKNIDNIKNVHFDTIIINKSFSKMEELCALLSNTKNIIVNMDEEIDLTDICLSKLNLISYGFNSKSSITISSIEDDEVLVYIQRNIYKSSSVIEVQEVKIENSNNYGVYDLIIVLVLFFLYNSTVEQIHINGIK